MNAITKNVQENKKYVEKCIADLLDVDSVKIDISNDNVRAALEEFSRYSNPNNPDCYSDTLLLEQGLRLGIILGITVSTTT
jgi:hypothetical protein